VAASITDLLFGVVGLYLMAVNNGWFWQLRELWKAWYESDDEAGEKEPGAA
jgi:hypothetical protein